MPAARDLSQLTLTQQTQLIDELIRREQLEPGTQRRRHRRITFKSPKIVTVHVRTGSCTDQFNVLLRNLSAAGCSFLHNVFLYPQTGCLLDLPAIDGESPAISGTIRRCTLVSGWVHEIGVQFASPIDVDRYIDDSDRPRQSESEDPAWSEGRRLLQKIKLTLDSKDRAACDAGIEEFLAWRRNLSLSVR